MNKCLDNIYVQGDFLFPLQNEAFHFHDWSISSAFRNDGSYKKGRTQAVNWGDGLLCYAMEHRLKVGPDTGSIGVKSWLYHVRLCDFGNLT